MPCSVDATTTAPQSCLRGYKSRLFSSPTRLALLFLVLVASASASQAAWAGYYMNSSQADLSIILAPPPAVDSARGQADLRAVLTAQNNRSKAQIREAQADAEESVFRFADVMGSGFNSRNLPFATRFFQRVSSDTEEAVAAAKDHFGRPRPFAVNHDIKPVVGRPGGPSYPSGHAAFAYVDAILLAYMEPDKAAAIFDRAEQYSYAREVGGVHYPTDLQAGRISASVIANVLLHEPRFIADLNRAKVEVRRATGLHP